MRIVSDIFLIVCVIGLWLFLSDMTTGTPTTLINYYFADYTSSTNGTIIRSRISTGKGGATTYHIKYSYTVDEKFYTSDQVNFLANNTSIARDTVARYPEGRIVTVYYDKSRPMLSTLEVTHLEFTVWGVAIATLFMIIVSILLLPLNGVRRLWG